MYTSISAFYCNDGDTGLGISVTPVPPAEDVDDVAAMIVAASDHYRRTEAHPADLLADLREYAALIRRDEELSEQERIIVLCLVSYLEEIGVIKADNFNGMLFAKEITPTH